jgi:hypothetical protein
MIDALDELFLILHPEAAARPPAAPPAGDGR